MKLKSVFNLSVRDCLFSLQEMRQHPFRDTICNQVLLSFSASDSSSAEIRRGKMRSSKSRRELDDDVQEILESSNECWAEFVLTNEVGLSTLQKNSLIDVVIASKDQVRATSTLDRVVGLTATQVQALQAIAC